MKRKTFWHVAVVLLLATVSVANLSCNNTDTILDAESNSSSLSKQIAIVPRPKLDLVITSFTTNVPTTTTSCGGVLPNVSCFGGTRFFTATVVITNNGPSSLPAGNLQVLWNDLTAPSSQTQTVSHTGIPAGGSLPVSRPYYMGPCDCVPPPTFFTHSFNAVVDPNNLIKETNEGNNTSATYTACDGC